MARAKKVPNTKIALGEVCLRWLGIFIIGLCGFGCQNSVFSVYEGNRLPLEHVAVLLVPRGLEVMKIDDKPVTLGQFQETPLRQYDLVPGYHTVDVMYYVRNMRSSEYGKEHKTFTRNFRKGYVYECIYETTSTVGSVGLTIKSGKQWAMDLYELGSYEEVASTLKDIHGRWRSVAKSLSPQFNKKNSELVSTKRKRHEAELHKTIQSIQVIGARQLTEDAKQEEDERIRKINDRMKEIDGAILGAKILVASAKDPKERQKREYTLRYFQLEKELQAITLKMQEDLARDPASTKVSMDARWHDVERFHKLRIEQLELEIRLEKNFMKRIQLKNELQRMKGELQKLNRKKD